MNPAQRLSYLTALGLTPWTLRSAQPAARDDAPLAAGQPQAAWPEPPVAVDPAASGASVPRETVAPPPQVPSTVMLDWDQLRARVAACTRCALSKTRTQTVFGVGNPSADWLIVGEAPGAEEDRRGEPFVGRAGQLLNSMLRAVGLAREQVYIANVLKCRPPGNRDPQPSESAECLPYLERQIGLLRPKVMLAVGRIAAQNLLKTDAPLTRLRLKVHSFGGDRVPLVVTYHPAYLLRTPTDKRKAWDDLKFAREVCARVQR